MVSMSLTLFGPRNFLRKSAASNMNLILVWWKKKLPECAEGFIKDKCPNINADKVCIGYCKEDEKEAVYKHNGLDPKKQSCTISGKVFALITFFSTLFLLFLLCIVFVFVFFTFAFHVFIVAGSFTGTRILSTSNWMQPACSAQFLCHWMALGNIRALSSVACMPNFMTKCSVHDLKA